MRNEKSCKENNKRCNPSEYLDILRKVSPKFRNIKHQTPRNQSDWKENCDIKYLPHDITWHHVTWHNMIIKDLVISAASPWSHDTGLVVVEKMFVTWQHFLSQSAPHQSCWRISEKRRQLCFNLKKGEICVQGSFYGVKL